MKCLFADLGGQENRHIPALQLGGFVQGGHLGTQLGELVEQIASDLGVRHLAAAEADGDFDAVATSSRIP